MSVQAKNTFRTEFYIHDGTDYVEIKGLSTITPPSIVTDAPIDVTDHQSPGSMHKYISAGLRDWSECTGTIHLDFADAGQQLLRSKLSQSAKFKIHHPAWPAAEDLIFEAVVVSLTLGALELQGVQTQEFNLKPSGDRLTA